MPMSLTRKKYCRGGVRSPSKSGKNLLTFAMPLTWTEVNDVGGLPLAIASSRQATQKNDYGGFAITALYFGTSWQRTSLSGNSDFRPSPTCLRKASKYSIMYIWGLATYRPCSAIQAEAASACIASSTGRCRACCARTMSIPGQ